MFIQDENLGERDGLGIGLGHWVRALGRTLGLHGGRGGWYLRWEM